jgi:hypothetical protein
MFGPESTVIDSSTGLMWEKKTDGVKRNWRDAIRYCENLYRAGLNDWWLPNQEELMSLFRNKKRILFTFDSSDPTYWTDTGATSRNKIVSINFVYGNTFFTSGNQLLNVRCVRGGN